MNSISDPNWRLSILTKEIPLSKNWATPEVFTEEFTLENFSTEVVGLASENDSGQSVVGSSMGSDGKVIDIAYYELIERISIMEVLNERPHKFNIVNSDLLQTAEYIDFDVAYPANEEIDYKFSLSNGTSFHTDKSLACENAKYELFERDLILRSWFGHYTPQEIVLADYNVVNPCPKSFEMKAYSIEYAEGPFEIYACFFCFYPQDNSRPIVYGSGASYNKLLALQKAQDEAFQRLPFLWDEEISQKSPAFSPTPDYHQEFYIRQSNKKLLASWLSGRHKGRSTLHHKVSPEVYYIDITPSYLKDKAYVIKALSSHTLPLIFGKNYSHIIGKVPRELEIHPVC